MRKILLGCAAAWFVLVGCASWAHAQRESIIVESSTQTVRELLHDPYRGIPRDVLRQSKGVIIFPNMLQAGFVFGARHGRGLVLVRDESGEWSNPFFVRMTGGSFGLQVGADTNEIMMVFQERSTIDRFLMGQNKLTFGVDASIAVGPSGAGMGAKTDPAFRADILVYTRARGLFAGAAVGGAIARVDTRANWNFYGLDAAPSEIVENIEGLSVPDSVARLKQELTLREAVASKRTTPKPAAVPAARKTEVAPSLEPIPGFEPDDGGFSGTSAR